MEGVQPPPPTPTPHFPSGLASKKMNGFRFNIQNLYLAVDKSSWGQTDSVGHGSDCTLFTLQLQAH